MAKHNALTEGDQSGYTTPSNLSSGHSVPMSPNASSATSVSVSSLTRFEGAHFFAGHADAVVPRQRRNLTFEVMSLEEKLKAVTDDLNEANVKQGKLAQELSIIRLEKEQVETTMRMELQGAEDTIAALEKEMPRLESLNSQLKGLLDEKKVWEKDRSKLAERTREVDTLERRLVSLEEQSGKASGIEASLAEAKESSRKELQKRDLEIRELRMQWQADRTQWERDKAIMEDAKARITEDLEDGLSALRTLVQTHRIVLFSRDTSLPGIVSSIGSHLTGVVAKAEGHGMVKEEWESTRRKLEEEIARGNEKREALYKDIEEARREREEARKELRAVEGRVKVSPTMPLQRELTSSLGTNSFPGCAIQPDS
jgi:predicted  nucleic acid-binding Zn-ribbon protein